MSLTLLFFVFGLAAWRLTHLLIDDTVPYVERPMTWLRSKVKPDGNLDYLLGCYFCLGFWVAAPFALLWYWIATPVSNPFGWAIGWDPRTFFISLAVWFALSAFPPYLETTLDRLNGDTE